MNSAIDFTNKTFVVAGAGGIGAATAKTLNAYGARILLLDLNENNLNRTLLELKGEGIKHIYVTSRQSILLNLV